MEKDVKKKDFVFFQPLITTTKAVEVKKFVDNFFGDNDLSWDIVYAICLDGARVMLEQNSGFYMPLKADAPHITVTHCLLHRYALATKTFTSKLAEAFVVEYVNYVQNNAMKQRIFKKLCNQMSSVFEVLLLVVIPGKDAEPCFYLACGIGRVIARAPTLSCRLFKFLSLFLFWHTWSISSMLPIISINRWRMVESTLLRHRKNI